MVRAILRIGSIADKWFVPETKPWTIRIINLYPLERDVRFDDGSLINRIIGIPLHASNRIGFLYITREQPHIYICMYKIMCYIVYSH